MQFWEKSGWSLQQHWDRGKNAAHWINSSFHKPREWRSNKVGCGWIPDHVQCILELQLNLYIPQERKRGNATVKSTLPNEIERSMRLLHYYKCQHTIKSQLIYAKYFTELEWNLVFNRRPIEIYTICDTCTQKFYCSSYITKLKCNIS